MKPIRTDEGKRCGCKFPKECLGVMMVKDSCANIFKEDKELLVGVFN